MTLDESDILLNLGAEAYQTGTPEGFKTAVAYYQKSAALGNSQAMTNLGYCYTYGRGVQVDQKRGFQYFIQAAKLGNFEAVMKVADAYQKGKFVEKDEINAYKMYLKLYHHLQEIGEIEEYPEVCLRLGNCAYSGMGTKKDIQQACTYFELAAAYYRQREHVYFYYPKQRKQAEEMIRKCDQKLAAENQADRKA